MKSQSQEIEGTETGREGGGVVRRRKDRDSKEQDNERAAKMCSFVVDSLLAFFLY